MSVTPAVFAELEPVTSRFYLHALAVLSEAKVPFLLGGAYALSHYTGIARHTKDLDLFVRPDDAPRALNALAHAGYRTELTFSHWLGKAFSGDDFVDVIFSSGNGLCTVDDDWFRHAVAMESAGAALLCPVEEIIWQKAFIMERERFDGADVNHLLRACGPVLNWERLLRRFDTHWQLLLVHLMLFGFVYPAEQAKIPSRIFDLLLERWRKETQCADAQEKICRGPLLSRMQYLIDTERWSYQDARLSPCGEMTPEQITHWTAAGR
ncbi:MAG TPA: hypothetical protein VN688_33885 [Gemmataceae bacterium]|nr:hypothetical protein [Gemmataceae bacterium]